MPIETQKAFPNEHDNINLLWANLLVEELIRHGIKDFCIAPGSRSTPLTLAVASHPKATSHVHFDERGLGFLGLGLSQASLKPVVIITTSGTAVANLYPAMIEAKQSNIPLIILSADRPPELIGCSANQAIDQYKIFADYPVFFSQIPSPTTSIKSNFLLTTLNQGLFQQKMTNGPIHFNLSFAEPFYPKTKKINYETYLSSLKNWLTSNDPFTLYAEPSPLTLASKVDLMASRILVVVGRIKDKQQAEKIDIFCSQHSLPLFADIQSQLQGSKNNINGYDLLIENATFTTLIQQAELILQFSDQLISKRLNQIISTTQASVWQISEHKQRIDQGHCVTQRFVTTPCLFIANTYNKTTTDRHWLKKIRAYQTILKNITGHYLQDKNINEINSSGYLLTQDATNLILGNSLAIRLADMFGQTSAHIYSNRGASGIDGLISTAVGIAKNNTLPSCLLIGDISFLYDLNSLTLLTQLQRPFTIVLLNNDGGGIFNLLPVPKDQQQTFYQLPHGLTFQKVCEQFSIDYYQPSQFSDFKRILQNSLLPQKQLKTTLIEVRTNNDLTAMQLQTIKEQIKNATI